MEYRQLGRSGLRVSTLALGTATFGGKGALGLWGSTDVAGARRLIDRCVGAGVNLVDTADAYSSGLSEEILGEALQGGHADVLVATKARLRMGDGPNDAGLSRHHLIEACEASLRRLRRDHIDLYQVHTWDGQTPLEETLSALDVLVQAAIVELLGELRSELGLSMLFVTHNLPLVRSIADTVAVMNQGAIVEFGRTEAVIGSPQQEYTKRLIHDTPSIEASRH